MLNIIIPGFDEFKLEHLVLDFNGTIAFDGILLKEVPKLLKEISKSLQVHVVTGDSYGSAKNELKNIDCKILILPVEGQRSAKLQYIDNLNPKRVVAIGKGSKQTLMDPK